MKESKSHSSSKRKTRSSKEGVKARRLVSPTKEENKTKRQETESKILQKTRWDPKQSTSTTGDGQVSACKKEEKSYLEHHLRIKDLLGNKEKIVEYLFLTMTGSVLEELIPDYLKKRSIDELKTLCAAEIQKMSSDEILQIISGKSLPHERLGNTTNPMETVSTEKSKQPKEENLDSKSLEDRISLLSPSPATNGSFSDDVLELCPSSNDMKCITDEENQTPISIEEVARDLQVSEKDSELLELEMRARAIRSLLKARSQDMPDSDSRDFSGDE